MGGKQSKEITKMDIENEINLEIKNEIINFNSIIKQTINKTLINFIYAIVNERIAYLQKNDTNLIYEPSLNYINDINDINQQISVNVINHTIIQITNDVYTQTKLFNQIKQDILNRTKNDSVIKTLIVSILNLRFSIKNNNPYPFTVLLADVIKMLDENTGVSQIVNSETETRVKNIVKSRLKNTYLDSSIDLITKNNIENIIKNVVDSSITPKTLNSCSNITNEQNISDKQYNFLEVDAFKKLSYCIISIDTEVKIATDIINLLSQIFENEMNRKVGTARVQTNKNITDDIKSEMKYKPTVQPRIEDKPTVQPRIEDKADLQPIIENKAAVQPIIENKSSKQQQIEQKVKENDQLYDTKPKIFIILCIIICIIIIIAIILFFKRSKLNNK